MVGTMIVYCF